MPKKFHLNLIISLVLIAFLGGCASFQPVLNPKYFSSSAPEKPTSRIELPQEVVDTISMASIQNLAVNADIHWIARDKLILRVGVWGKEAHYATYLIAPSNGKIKKLQGAREKRVLKKAV